MEKFERIFQEVPDPRFEAKFMLPWSFSEEAAAPRQRFVHGSHNANFAPCQAEV